MGQVISSASMSLDGYIAKADNTIGHLFDWLQNGDVEFPTASPDIILHLTAPSATYLNQWVTGWVHLSAAVRCSISPGGGAAGTRWTCRWSW